MSGGRPKRTFTDEEKQQIEQMAQDNCHLDTIALALSIAKTTLVRRYGTFIEQKRAQGRTELSHQQKEKCAKGDSAMLIWRGKQDLSQTDKQVIETKSDAVVMSEADRQALADLAREYKLKLARG